MKHEGEYECTLHGQRYYIPARMMEGIERYIRDHIRPGKFLQSVIALDLLMALGSADKENFLNLPAFVSYFYNEAPGNCWGSWDALDKWVNERREK